MYQVRDHWNNTIELTRERWEYITRWHPDLEDHLDDVLQTVKHGRRRQDPVDAHKYIYYRGTDKLWPQYNHIIVVVKWLETILSSPLIPNLLTGEIKMIKNELMMGYDREADVLYLSCGEPQKGLTYLEVDNNLIVRLHPETGKVVGLTILNFSQRFGMVESLVKIPVVGEFVMA